MAKTLTDWLAYLESLHPKTIALGLERVAKVRQRLDIEPDFPIITVGGTNGKGSVCAMLESILHAAGYRVGCYTSPHLLDYNERVRIAKKPASDAELCASFEKIEQARKPQQLDGRSSKLAENSSFSRLRGNDGYSEIPLTYFEFGTLAAMQCFVEHKVEIAILEVGLGGRLDAVNVFDSDCAVVASVGIDHTDYLGDTREQIAFEKAGIFRPGRVAICADGDVPQAIRSHAQQIGAELWCIGSEFGFEIPSPAGGRGVGGEGIGNGASAIAQPITLTLEKQLAIRLGEHATPAKSLVISRGERGQNQKQWNYRSKIGARNTLPYPALRGAFQLHNASAALAALDALKDKLPVSMEAVRRGLAEVRLAGRFQVAPGRPQLILDVAHNPHAARSLAQNLADMPPARTLAVFAMLADKDIAGVAAVLDPYIDTWLAADIAAPRGASAAELAEALRGAGVRGSILTFGSVGEALRYAYNAASENDRIAAFGSFHTVAAVMTEKGLKF